MCYSMEGRNVLMGEGGGGSVRIKPCEIARQNSEHKEPGTEKTLRTVRVSFGGYNEEED